MFFFLIENNKILSLFIENDNKWTIHYICRILVGNIQKNSYITGLLKKKSHVFFLLGNNKEYYLIILGKFLKKS